MEAVPGEKTGTGFISVVTTQESGRRSADGAMTGAVKGDGWFLESEPVFAVTTDPLQP